MERWSSEYPKYSIGWAAVVGRRSYRYTVLRCEGMLTHATVGPTLSRWAMGMYGCTSPNDPTSSIEMFIGAKVLFGFGDRVLMAGPVGSKWCNEDWMAYL